MRLVLTELARNRSFGLVGWPDTSPGLHGLKKHLIIATLSNGNVRLLTDMASLIFVATQTKITHNAMTGRLNMLTYLGTSFFLVNSSEVTNRMFPNSRPDQSSTYLDRNAKMYITAAKHLDVPTSKVAMVAAHVQDLRAAASNGMKTVYVRRPFEWSRNEEKIVEDESRMHEEFDVVVDSFLELVEVLEGKR